MNKITAIDYQELINIINSQLIEVMNKKYDFYKDYTVKVAAEQQFIKKAFKDNPKCICIVIKFGATSINFAQSVVTGSIVALSEANQVKVAKQLLNDYSQAFNLVKVSDGTIQQLYDSPSVSQNFEYEAFGIKSIVSIEGAFILSKTANDFTLYNICITNATGLSENVILNVLDLYKFVSAVGYTGDDDIIYSISKTASGYTVTHTVVNSGVESTVTDFSNKASKDIGIMLVDGNGDELTTASGITLTLSTMEEQTLDQSYRCSFSLDSQVMYGHRNFSSSVGKFGSITISYVSYLMFDSTLQNQCLAMAMKKRTSNISSFLNDTYNIVNNTFALKIVFKSGLTAIDRFECLMFDAKNPKGQIPSVEMAFGN